jgi:hypothetical protein
MRSLRRIAALARATARDLFAGHGAALLLIALVAAIVATRTSLGRSEEELRAVALRERTAGAAIVALLAVAIAATQTIADDRRSRRLAQLLATPLRPFEYLVARWLGVGGGLVLPLVALQVALLALPEAGLLRHPEQFAPSATSEATRVVWKGDGSGALADGRVAVLHGGDRIAWTFDPPALPAGGFRLELALRAIGEGGGDAPAIALELDGRPWIAHRELRSFVETTLREPLPADARPHEVALRLVGTAVHARIETDRCRLLGEQRSPLASLARAASGATLLLLFAAGVAAALAVALPDVLALVATALVALLGFLQPLLVEVAANVASDPEHASLATRRLAQLLGAVSGVLPDLSTLVASERLASAAPPFARGDLALHAWPLLFALAALSAAALVLRRSRRAAPRAPAGGVA